MTSLRQLLSLSLARRAVWVSRLLQVLTVVLTLGVRTGSAHAESASDRATARALAKEGFEALKSGDFETAEDRFRRADALVHAPTLVVDHARALVGLGKLVEAQERYELVIREGVAPNASPSWKRAYTDAQTEVEQLKDRLAWLTINVTGPDKPQVTIDGKAIPAAAIGVRRATDPGERTIVAGGPGYLSKEQSITLDEGEEQVMDIELDPDPNAAKEEAAPEAQSAAPQHQVAVDSGLSDDEMIAYVALGVGAVGIVGGSVTGLLALRKRSELDKECDNGACPESSRTKIDTYRTFGTISGVAYGVGLAGAAAGVTLLLLSGPQSSSSVDAGAATLTPYFTGNSLGVYGHF